MNCLRHELALTALVLAAAGCGRGLGSSARAQEKPGSEAPPAVRVVNVKAQQLALTARLPGELRPYEAVAVYSKVAGFVKWIGVDRGSMVKADQVIASLEAPEFAAQRAEAQARLQAARSQLAAAESKSATAQGTYERLKAASATPGAVAGNDVEVAEHTASAQRAQVKAADENVNAARQALGAFADLESYLKVKAPFDGVVTERNVHPGALVGAANSGNATPMFRIELVSTLRLVVPVPESYVSGVSEGESVEFTVPAWPGEKHSGKVTRLSRSLDAATRTMPVEADVANPDGRLDPGMFPQVLWPVRRPAPSLFVPSTSTVRTTEKLFVVRIKDGKADWVDVRTGATSGNLIEVFGDLNENDQVLERGTDELRPGTKVGNVEVVH